MCLSVLRAFGILICEKNVETLRPGKGVFIKNPPSHMTMGNNADGCISSPYWLGPHLAGLPLGKLKIAAAYLGKKSHANLPTKSPAPACFSCSLGSNQVSTPSSLETAYASLIT